MGTGGEGASTAAALFLQDLAGAWHPDGATPTIRTGRAARSVPAGHRYLALPPSAPRVLLPLEAPAATAGVLVANAPLRSRSERYARRALSWAVRTGVAGRVLNRAAVGVERVAGGATLLSALQEQWDHRVAALSFSIRPRTPNHKPTFVAVDRRGAVLGYGKIAPSAGTADRVLQEVDGLRWMARHDVPGLRAPDVLASVDWRGCAVVVVSPVPADSRRCSAEAVAPAHLLRHAQSEGHVLDVADLARRLLARVVAGDDAEARDAEVEDAAGGFVETLVARSGDLTLAAGRLHGDWVPWNLAERPGELWAFDWEHSEPESAAGLDLVHWHLLLARDRHRSSLREALAVAEECSAVDLPCHGLSAAEVTGLQALGRLRIAARAAALHRDSGLWVGEERATILAFLAAQPGGVTER